MDQGTKMESNIHPKKLQMILQPIKPFEKASTSLEQYPTTAHLASQFMCFARDDITNKTVADFGCGTGMLSLAALVLGATYVCGFEIDTSAIKVLKENFDMFDLKEEVIKCDITQLKATESVQTVIMNPPFGTKQNAGIDIIFLEKAVQFAKESVWSMHKTSTRKYIIKTMKNNPRVKEVKIMAEMKFDLPQTMKFHKKKLKQILVDLIKIEIIQ